MQTPRLTQTIRPLLSKPNQVIQLKQIVKLKILITIKIVKIAICLKSSQLDILNLFYAHTHTLSLFLRCYNYHYCYYYYYTTINCI